MKYIPGSNTYSLFKNNKVFSASLSLAPYTQDDLFLGSIINLQSRQMTVSEVPSHLLERTPKNCLIFAVDSYQDLLNVLTQTDQYKLTNLKLGTVDRDVISNLDVREGQRVVAVEFVGVADNSLKQDSKCVAVLDCYDKSYNSNQLFRRGLVQQPLNKTVSLCIIKPHIVKSHLLSKVVDEIVAQGFELSSLELNNLNKFEVDEIFEVYKGVLNDYVNMREHLISGPSVVITVEKNENVVDEFRTLCGPHDPEIAK